MRTLLAVTLSAMTLTAQAQIYKCTGADGKVNFTDSPCSSEQQAQTIDRVPPQGLDKMRIDLERRQAEHAQFEAEYQAKNAADERKERQLYLSRRMHEGLRIGMTEEEVESLPQWRWSEDSNVTQTAGVEREQRVFRASYDNEYEHMYLYFVNGVLTVIQD